MKMLLYDILDMLDLIILLIVKRLGLSFRIISGIASFGISYVGYLYCGFLSWIVITTLIWSVAIYTCGEWFAYYSCKHMKVRLFATVITICIVSWVIFMSVNVHDDFLGEKPWILPVIYVSGALYSFLAGVCFYKFRRFLKKGEKAQVTPLKYIYFTLNQKLKSFQKQEGG